MLTSIISFTNIKHFLIMFYMFIFIAISVIDSSGEKSLRQRQDLSKIYRRLLLI